MDGPKPETIAVGSSLEVSIEMQLCKIGIDDGSDHRPVVKTGPAVAVHGTRTPGVEMKDGCAVTHGVDRAFFDKWLEQNPAMAGRLFTIAPLP